jgi:hypothetical protein
MSRRGIEQKKKQPCFPDYISRGTEQILDANKAKRRHKLSLLDI